jgi:hydroxyethylthiazole kinase-like uncharacterized protein yjeF
VSVNHLEVTQGLLRDWPLPSSHHEGTKETRGQVVVVAGAAQTPGAVLLAGVASLRAGAGKLTMATVNRTAVALGVALPEALVQGLAETPEGAIAPSAKASVITLIDQADAVLLGPGMTDEDACSELVAAVLPEITDATVVLDALALAHLERDRSALHRFGGRAIMTPNRSELALLLGTDEGAIDRDPCAAARQAAERFQAVISVGGGESWVAAPDGTAWHDTSGGIGLGVSGAGDCAAGVVAGLAARGAGPAQSAVWAAYLHGRAGDRLASCMGRTGYLAREIANEVCRVLDEIGY